MQFSKQISQFSNFIIALLTGIAIFLGPHASATESPGLIHRSAKLPSFVRVLSFDELMNLPRTKRTAYIHGLRRLLVDIDHKVSSRGRGHASIGIERSTIARLLALYDSSIANAEDTLVNPHAPKTPYLGLKGVTCDPPYAAFYGSYSAFHGSLDPKLYVCTPGTKCASGGGLCAKRDTKRCADGQMPVNQNPDGEFLCATNESFNLLNGAMKHNSRVVRHTRSILDGGIGAAFEDGYPKAESFRSEFQAQQTQQAQQAQQTLPKPSLAVLPKPAVQPKSVAAPAKPVVAATSATVPSRVGATGKVSGNAEAPADAAAARALALRSGTRSQGAPTGTVRVQLPPGAGAVASSTVPSRTNGGRLGSDRSQANRRSQGAELATVAPLGASTSQAPSSGASAPEQGPEWSGEGAQSSDQDSASGPTVSGAAESNDGPQVVGDGDSGSEQDAIEVAPLEAPAALKACAPDAETVKTCNSDEVEKARNKYASDKEKLECIYAGSISTYTDGKKQPFHCEAPTRFCYSPAHCEDGEGNKQPPDFSCSTNQVLCNPLIFGVNKDGKTPYCVSRQSKATVACDEASGDDSASPLDQKHSGLKEAWNDFADGLFKLCQQDPIAAQLHCEECDIIRKRLFALDVAARDVKTCGQAIKYEDANCGTDGACDARPGASSTGDASKRAGTRSRSRGTASVAPSAAMTTTPATPEVESVWNPQNKNPKNNLKKN